MHPFHRCLATQVSVALSLLFATACGDDDRSAKTTQDESDAAQEDAAPAGDAGANPHNYQCWAYQQEGSGNLVGACSTNGQEVSQCSPRVNNGTMTLTPRTATPLRVPASAEALPLRWSPCSAPVLALTSSA